MTMQVSPANSHFFFGSLVRLTSELYQLYERSHNIENMLLHIQFLFSFLILPKRDGTGGGRFGASDVTIGSLKLINTEFSSLPSLV